MPGPCDEFDPAKPRSPRNLLKEFASRGDVIGFGATRFHDLRGVHSTALPEAGTPVWLVYVLIWRIYQLRLTA